VARKSSTALIKPPFAADTIGLAGTPVNNLINSFNCPVSNVIGLIAEEAGAKGLATTVGVSSTVCVTAGCPEPKTFGTEGPVAALGASSVLTLLIRGVEA